MNRRNGTTLTEVLVAIFIMGIGLMAILSLFPLGAAQMAQALKDQRAAEAAGNAISLARVIWKQACEADTSGIFRDPATQLPRSIQRFVYALDDPNFNDMTAFPLPGMPTPLYPHMTPMPLTGQESRKSSYPVYVDMFGWQANQINPSRQWWVGEEKQQAPHNKVGLIPRRPLYVRDPSLPSSDWRRLGIDPPFNSLQRIHKQFSLLDDMTFTTDGRVADSSGNPAATGGRIERQGRYSWAYMYRRPNNTSEPSERVFRQLVDLTIVVYSGRSIDVPTDEKTYQAIVTDPRSVRLVYSGAGDKPALKRGYWLLDATMFDGTANGAVFPQGRFYRAVNIDDGPSLAGSPTLNVELQKPLAQGPTERVFVVMSNVVEVFPIGTVSPKTPPRNSDDDQDERQRP